MKVMSRRTYEDKYLLLQRKVLISKYNNKKKQIKKKKINRTQIIRYEKIKIQK